MRRTVVDAVMELLRTAGCGDVPIKIITARSAVRAGWPYGELRGPLPAVIEPRRLLVRASAVAGVEWLPLDTTHIYALDEMFRHAHWWDDQPGFTER